MRSPALALIGLVTVLLAGCGFHPAGTRPLPDPLKRVRIDMVQPYRVSEPPVETALRDRLTRRGATVETKDEDGVTLIRLSELKESREVLSVGADGKALEYELILRLKYEVRAGQQVWVPPSIIEARRDYSFNAQQVLPKEQEAERLREYLEDELAELLLLRIEAATAHALQMVPSPATTAPPETQPGAIPAGPTAPGAGAPAAAPATSPDAAPTAAAPTEPPAAPAPEPSPAPAETPATTSP